MEKIKRIENTINKIDNLIKKKLPESKYQFELYDLATNTKHFRGLKETFHWGSVYKIFVVAEIIKMAEEGLINLEDELILHKEKFKNGSGILKYFTHLDRLTYLDACKMTISTSDNLCADELLEIVGIERLNKLFESADCHSLKLSDNLDSLVAKLFAELPKQLGSKFIYSEDFYKYYDEQLPKVLENNFCTSNDLNRTFHFINSSYLESKFAEIFKDCISGLNVWTRLNNCCHFSSFTLKGKTGNLGFGIANIESVAIINKNNQRIEGYFTINTKENKKRKLQSDDTFGLIGLEIASLYEELEKIN